MIDVCIDDTRTYGDVIIRDPRIAIPVLKGIITEIGIAYWDNDMGHGWEFEGRNLLKTFLADCKAAGHWPVIILVSSNSVAVEDMQHTLRSAGYSFNDGAWTHE